MKKYYKLTNQKMQTYNGFQWKLGKWQEAQGDIKKRLCSDAWLHCYDSPLLAVLHNPIHANIKNPRLFEIEADGKTKDDRGIKRGFRKMRIIKEILLPKITRAQKIAYSLLCAKEVCKDEKWNEWADNWLSGKDRTKNAADAAYAAADAAYTAAYAAADAAADAAYAAADAAYAAADAAYAADAAAAAAAYAAYTAAYAAAAAADAADAADAAYALDLIKIAEKAITDF